MKRSIHRISALACAAALALSLTACGDQGGDKGKAETDPLTAAQENMKNVTSMDAKMDMAMDMAANGQTLSTVTTMDMTYFSDPVKLKTEMTVDMGEAGVTSVSVYAQAGESDAYTLYMSPDGTNWVSQSVQMADLEQYDARSSMDLYMTSGTDFKESGDEQVDGKDCVKYAGVITGAALEEVMKSSGALDSMSSLTSAGLTQEQLDGMLTDLGDLPIAVWIDKAENYPVKFELDMTGIMNTLMSKVIEALGAQAEGLELEVPKMLITMTCSNFNNATDFTIPAEALAA